MILFPNCKINLGLRVICEREDGYHNIETVFLPVDYCDALEIIRTDNGPTGFTTSGLSSSVGKDNLCVKAYELLKAEYPDLPPVSMYLHKAIPVGAGLGGGSADAAFTLMLLNRKFALGLTTTVLTLYAQRLGSDCPFFIMNKPCFATGRGDTFHPVDCDLSSYKIVLVNPGIHISTAWAYSKVKPSGPLGHLPDIIAQPVETWKDQLTNDFEKPVFEVFPALMALKEQLYDAGAVYASMTGSGSTFFGIFRSSSFDEGALRRFPDNYWIKLVSPLTGSPVT